MNKKYWLIECKLIIDTLCISNHARFFQLVFLWSWDSTEPVFNASLILYIDQIYVLEIRAHIVNI